jgi:eukaryotic-like serine/threonine-protein kinase
MESNASAWQRIRSARLVQILGVYLGISFGILQAVDIFAARLPIPDWTFVATLILLLVGLPIITATALLQTRSKGGRRPWLTWGRTLRGGVAGAAGLALVVAGITVLGVLGMGPAGSLIAKGVIDARERILIADFVSPTGDTTLAAALTEAFRVDFEQSPVVTLVPTQFVRDALVRMGRDPAMALDVGAARELAEREGIKALVAGEVSAVGRNFVVTARLLSAEDGAVLASHRESADSASLIGAVDQLSKTLRRQIGESLRSLRANEPLEQVSTPSLEALRRYSQAVRAADMDRDHDRAVNLLEEAIRLDPGFAMAHRKLGVVLTNQAGPSERVRDALRAAYEHRDRLTDRERHLTLGTYYRYVELDDDRAASAYRTLLDLHPEETSALNNLAIIYSAEGDHARAEELYRRALAIDSLGSLYHTNLFNQLVAQGKLAAADSLIAAHDRRFPDHAQTHLMRAALAVNRQDYEAAGAAYQAVATDRSAPSLSRGTALLDVAQLELLHGRPGAALETVREAIPLVPGLSGTGQDHGLEIAQAFVEAIVLADPAAAEARVERLLAERPLTELPPDDRPLAQLLSFYSELGRPDRVRLYLDSLLAQEHNLPERQLRVQQAFFRAHLALAEGRADDAIADLRYTQRESGCQICAMPLLGRAYIQAAEPDSAIAVLTRYLDTPWQGRLGMDATELPRAHLVLAGLHEARGDREAAARHYAAVLELWRDAEPVLQPRVEFAERSLRRLLAEGR